MRGILGPMTVTGQPDRPQQPDSDAAPRSTRRRDAGAVHEVCPYLTSAGGDWRSAYAAREHRCHAVEPPAQLAITKQRQLCLFSAHESCATFQAARALAVSAASASPGDEGAALWPVTASTPLVLEPARRMGTLPVATARSGGQALLIGLMVLAFAVLVIARTQSPGSSGAAEPSGNGGAIAAASGSPTPRPTPTAAPTPSPSVAPSPSPVPSPTASPTSTPAPTRTAAATAAATRSYKVKSGDTLSGIAARYGTTVAVLVKLNNLTDARLIRIGQVLRVP